MPDSEEFIKPAPVPAQRQKTKRIWYIFAISTSGLFFACAGCCFFSPYLFGVRTFDGPSGANQVAREIVDWSLPQGFAGVIGVTMDNMFFRFDLAKFKHDDGRGTIVIARTQWKAWALPEQQDYKSKVQKIVQDMVNQFAPELRKIDISQPEARNLTIHGLSGEVQLGRGEDRASTTSYSQVVGNFYEKSDLIFLILQSEDELMSDKDIDDFLNSIK